MLYREIIIVQFEKHTELINTVGRKNAEFFNIKADAYIFK
jgi:hypothetical protein